MYPDTFTGFQIDSAETWLDFKKREFQPKPFESHDVDIEIEACGICGSDLHTISGDWGEKAWPLCVGHEIVGRAVRVGPEVTLVRVGERVGVGALVFSCLKCRQCRAGNEAYCQHKLNTYGSRWPESGVISQGGYASHVRAHEFWVFPIPSALPSALAAPMLCAGLTAFSPLVRNGCGPGKKVGIVGLGGIGHYGTLFAKALGAETWVISRSHAKEADALKMGADGFIATADADWNVPHHMTFDLILNTASGSDGFHLPDYLKMLDVHGRWISVGLPSGAGQEVKSNMFMENGCLIGASHIGSRSETLQMLQLAADTGIKSWVEEIPITEANLATAVQRLSKTDVRYRFTLTEFDKAFDRK